MSLHSERRNPESWLVALVIVAFCVVAIWLSLSFEKMPPILKRGIQPSEFPQLVCVFIILLTGYMIWRDPVTVVEPMGKKTPGTIVLMALFVGLCSIDLFIALGLFAVALSVYWGERRLVLLATVGLVVPVAIFFLFDLVFKIRFPRGVLTNMWYG